MDRPPVFADQSFAAALEATRSSNRWLIVDATAEWCGPCRTMDRTTWRDTEVVSWLDAHAIALQVDVDREQEWARAQKISAMPTLIAFKAGAEVDRIVGGRKPRQLLDWLEGLERGETAVEQLRHSLDEAGSDINGRFELARALLAAGKFDEATDHFAWLWEHMAEIDPDMAGVRVSFLASEIGSLVAQDEAARSRFRAVRDRAGSAAGDELAAAARFDWIVLNEVLGEPDATLAWLDRVLATHPGAPGLARFGGRLIPLLLSRDRWADAARFVDDGVADLARHNEMSAHEFPPDFDEQMKAQFQEWARYSLRQKAAEIRQILIAGGRTDDATAVERAALSLDSSDEMKAWLAKSREQVAAER